jgi:2-dehydropantoate 2-reductase
MKQSKPQNVLLVGAGAVGLVYGYHLAKGGANVSFFVKEKYAEDARKGFVLYPLNQGRQVPAVHWKDAGVVTSTEEVAAANWDQVWLCMSATALRGDWLPTLLEAAGDNTTVVSLQPGLEDREYMLQFVPAARLVCGVITLISYQAPLDGETREPPGIAYWFPPMSPNPFDGERANTVAGLLRAGKCPAVAKKQLPNDILFLSACMMSILGVLEDAGWSFSTLRRSSTLALGIKAAHQGMTVVARVRGLRLPLFRLFVRPWIVRMMMPLSRWIMPFDIETYLQYHFTKVGDQTRFMLQVYHDRGVEQSLPVDAIQDVLALLAPASQDK